MKHLVLVAGIYYPQPSPTGRCASQYVSLLKDNYHVDVIFIQSGLEKIYGVNFCGETLYGLSNWRLLTERWFAEKSRKAPPGILKNVLHIGIAAMKFVGRIQSMIFFPNNLRWFYKKAYEELKRIHNKNKIDVVFTVNSPFSAHLAGEAFKNNFPDVRWVTYTVDPFYSSYKIGRKILNKNNRKALSAEQKVLINADANLLSEEIYENGTELYASFKNKTVPLPYMLPHIDRQAETLLFDLDKINLVYAGRFYYDIRNPEYLLKTVINTKNEDLILHLYASSDCEELINKYVKQSSGRIIRHDLVEQNKIRSVLNSADILVSVGNSIPEFKPSKTFEYISTGKPIINFCRNKLLDTNLDTYPLAVQIDEDSSSIADSSVIMEKFSVESKGKNVDSKEIEHIYKKYSGSNIRSILYTAMEY